MLVMVRIMKICLLLQKYPPVVKLSLSPIFHPKEYPSLKMKLFPATFFQTGLFGASEALSSESKYNPPKEFEVELSPVT